MADLWAKGSTSKIDSRLHKRIVRRLEALDVAKAPEEINVPGYDFHALKVFRPTRYTIHVNGPWCITFAFEDTDAVLVELEQYH